MAANGTKQSITFPGKKSGGSQLETCKDFTAFNLDDYIAGKSLRWTFWDCQPSQFPWEYSQVEHAYILEGTFEVTYPGEKPVSITKGDFVRFPVGKTEFKVITPVRKFFTLSSEE